MTTKSDLTSVAVVVVATGAMAAVTLAVVGWWLAISVVLVGSVVAAE